MAEGTHFRSDADLADVAWKLVAANLSDLAAKGAEPVGVLLSYSLGAGDERFLAGLGEALQELSTPLLGGDTIRAEGPRTFGMTAVGKAPHRAVPLRSGARSGDAIYVTGVLGRAMLGFEGNLDHLEAFDRPRPLIREGQKIAQRANAMMDISDGLLLDAFRMAQASGRTFRIDSDKVPVADPARRDQCLRWGDDYQLLFTMAESLVPPVEATRIGSVIDRQKGPLMLDEQSIFEPQGLGYRHG